MSTELVARYEFKYAVPIASLAAVRRRLAQYCAPDRYGGNENDGRYRIDSLYLDTPEDRFYWDSENGMRDRLKLRVRTYPDAPESVVKIEVKRRSNELVTKTSAVAPRGEWKEWLSDPERQCALQPEQRQAVETYRGLERALHATPKILVRYTRRAFHSMFDDYVRITFDEEICYQRMQTYELTPAWDCWIPLDSDLGAGTAVLLEVKFRYRPPVWLADLIRSFDLTRIGYSKYGRAMRSEKNSAVYAWDQVARNPARWSGLARV